MKFLLPAAFAALLTVTGAQAGSPFPDNLKTGGFVVGCQAWTFNHFTVLEAIDKTAAAGGKVIEFFPGQKLSPEQADVMFSHEPARGKDRKGPSEKLSAEETKKVWDTVKAKCQEKNIQPVAYGVVGIPKDEAGARKIFEFAKYMGIRVINTESVDAIDTFEPLVKEYDIKVGFHDHPKRPNDPNYKMWDPEYILSVVKDRDSRIGSCADTGHWVRSGLKPVDCIRILKGHIVASHLKDLNAPLPSAHDMPWGQGVSDVPGILAEYKAQGFEGPISVEYEYHMEDNSAEVKECIDWIRENGPKAK